MVNLVTGASGFIGRYLVAHLRREHPDEKTVGLSRSEFHQRDVTHYSVDMNERSSLRSALAQISPDRVYHLAGISRVSDALPGHFEQGFLTTVALFEELKTLSRPVRVFLASSAHVYGNQEGSISEEAPARPVSAYGFCKYLAEQTSRHAVQASNIKVVVGRLYNCIGPGQGEGFVVSDLARRILKAVESKNPVLKTGSLSARRQFIDIRDLVELLPKLLATEFASSIEVFNIASPHSRRIEEIVQMLLKVVGRKVKIESDADVARNPFRGLDLNTSRLQSLLQPTFRSLETSVEDLFHSIKSAKRPS